MTMRILVTNDDGLEAPGLWALAWAAEQFGHVTVVAPETDQSGQSAALAPLVSAGIARVGCTPPMSVADTTEVYVVRGTPAVCVLLAWCHLDTARFDLVLSGINRGPNVASDVWFSGTVGAARTARLLGAPALAVSLDEDPRQPDVLTQWPAAALVAAAMGRALAETRVPLLLNLNLPNRSLDELAGLAVTRPSTRVRPIGCEVLASDPASYSVRMEPWASGLAESGSDLWALGQGLASVSALPPLPDAQVDLEALCRTVAHELGVRDRPLPARGRKQPAGASRLSAGRREDA